LVPKVIQQKNVSIFFSPSIKFEFLKIFSIFIKVRVMVAVDEALLAYLPLLVVPLDVPTMDPTLSAHFLDYVWLLESVSYNN